jgi:hypothetical protein
MALCAEQRREEYMNRKYWETGLEEDTGRHPSYSESTPKETTKPAIRTFDTGATRDKDEHKNDYEGFFSPLVFRRYGNYMQEHRKQKDGSVRDSDNWQKGMGLAAFMKSKWRHFVDIWTIFDGYKAIDFDGAEVDLEDALCADLFNTMGYLHEVLKAKLELTLKEIRAKEDKEFAKSFEDAIRRPNHGDPLGQKKSAVAQQESFEEALKERGDFNAKLHARLLAETIPPCAPPISYQTGGCTIPDCPICEAFPQTPMAYLPTGPSEYEPTKE